MASRGRRPQNREMLLRLPKRPMRVLMFILFSLCCWQVFWWRHQAVAISWFQIKSIVRQISTNEKLEWGAICNGLQDFDCAATVFGKIVGKNPNHRLALSNYAIAEARRDNCKLALRLFENYRQGGPEGPETLYWGGYCLQQMKRLVEARNNYYLSTAQSPDATQAPEALVDLLYAQGLREEALSIIAALTEGRPSRSERWRAKFAELTLRSRIKDSEVGRNSEVGRRALRVPCLDGQNFWMPVQFSLEAPPEFVTIDPEQSAVTLNQDQFLQRLPAKAESETSNLAALQIGPWLFKDVEFSTCSNCTSVVGRSLLDHFEVSEDMEASVRFLILTPN